MKKIKLKIYIMSIVALLIDFFTKSFIVSKMALNSSKEIINNFFYITYIHNDGAAFGILENNRIFLIGISLVFLIMFVYYIEKNTYNKIQEIAYSFLLGGIIGNLIDRIFRGYVIDFLDFKLFGFDYPVFNMADSFIVVSIFVIIIIYIKEIINERRK